mmetsp:Transcript_94898/g.173814  ORF Transcript_94898/g.173814 Transcript_94898/m.173814 type:complete len:90 (+) Transcript_94898:77-346(+)
MATPSSPLLQLLQRVLSDMDRTSSKDGNTSEMTKDRHTKTISFKAEKTRLSTCHAIYSSGAKHRDKYSNQVRDDRAWCANNHLHICSGK